MVGGAQKVVGGDMMGNTNEQRQQLALSVYAALVTFMSLLGGFVYTGIIAILLIDSASSLIAVIRVLLWAFSAITSTILLWHLAVLHFTGHRSLSPFASIGNFTLITGIVLIFISLLLLVQEQIGLTKWDWVWFGLSGAVCFGSCGIALWMVSCRASQMRSPR